MKRGMAKEKHEIARKMKEMGDSIEKIQTITGLPPVAVLVPLSPKSSIVVVKIKCLQKDLSHRTYGSRRRDAKSLYVELLFFLHDL